MTKAKTKGQRKRGRPRIEGVARTENGRISRVKEQPSQLALEARARMHKLTIERARDQQAGTFLGRLHMAYVDWAKTDKSKPQPDQSISTAQYHALLSCQQLYNDRLKVVSAPGAYYEPHLGSSGDEAAHERWGKSVNERWTDLHEAIQAEQLYDRVNNLWAALDLCVIQEQYLHHMVGSLRVLGNAIGRHFAKGGNSKEPRPFHKMAAE